jgi:preprotein translocase subunit SecB
MLKLRLTEMTVLSCSMEHRYAGDGEHDLPEDERSTYDPEVGFPDEQLIQLRVQSQTEEAEATAWIEGKLEDKRLPFRLTFEMAFLFSIPETEVFPAPDEIEPTLVWIAFPYMREFIADLTGRTPEGQYYVPPLTRLPQPNQPAGFG